MHYYEVAPNQIIRRQSDVFTYASDKQLSIGQLVAIEVGKKELVGVVMRKVSKPSNFTTKPISSTLELPRLPEPIVQLAVWMGMYYHTHLATVLQTILPRGLHKTRRARPSATRATIRK